MRRIIAVIFVCLIGISAAGAQAEEQEWKTVRTSAFGGYVISYDRPGDWYEGKERFDNRDFRFREGGRAKTLRYREMASYFDNLNVSFTVRQFDLPQPVALDRWIEVKEQFWKHMLNKTILTHGKGNTKILGKTAFFFLSSRMNTYSGGKAVPTTGPTPKWRGDSSTRKVPATGPTTKDVMIVVDDRVVLEVRFVVMGGFTEWFKTLQPIFDRMLKSIKVTPVAKLDASQVARGYKSPEIRISQRRNYYLKISISLILPPGWSAGDPLLKPATAANSRGRMIVEIRRSKDPGGPSFLLVVEGVPPNRPLESVDYLATADRLIGKLMTKHGPGKTIMIGSQPWFFCMGHMKNRYWRGTGKSAHVRSYSGKDRKGRDVRARVYTAGGFSAACNLIFIARTKDFDKALPDIDAMIKSISSSEYSPAFRVR